MKVEIGAKSAARTIKVLVRALEIADKELDHQEKTIYILRADVEHLSREVVRLADEVSAEQSARKEYQLIAESLQREVNLFGGA